MLKDTLVVAVGEFGRSPRMGVSTSGNSNAPDGRDHWPYCYSAVVAGCGIARGRAIRRIGPDRFFAQGQADASQRSAGHGLLRAGHRSRHEVLNHLNQPRELVKGKVIAELWS